MDDADDVHRLRSYHAPAPVATAADLRYVQSSIHGRAIFPPESTVSGTSAGYVYTEPIQPRNRQMMRTSEKTDMVIPALLKARGHMTPAEKDGENTFHRYRYATEQAWHDAVQGPLLDYGLLLTFTITDCKREEFPAGKEGKEVTHLTTVCGTARVTHESGQWIEVDGVGEGDDKADKGAYKAMTGLKKYLYALAFALPTTDDVEDQSHDQQRQRDAVKSVTFKAPKKTQDEVNSELVAAGKPPVISAEEKEAAAKSYRQLFDLDKEKAKAIKFNRGTDYKKMKEELDLAIRENLERPTNVTQPK